jgi:succinyl-diaminopimelate desuccinylase
MLATTAMNSVALSQRLIRFASLNPPGDEADCIAFLVALLSEAGLEVETHDFEPGRPSIVARVRGTGQDAPLCFTGHIDVVPLGAKSWSTAPFAGEIADGKLFGRGSSDMKAGVAAFISATIVQVRKASEFKRGITLVITSGEESGCQGAFHLGRVNALGNAALMIVAEPSSNQPIVAHKGSLRIAVAARGKTAHSSMPEIGDNAIDKVAELVCKLRDHQFYLPAHPLLGSTTAAVTTITGGQNINSVPDSAAFTVDFRTIPSHSHKALLAEIGMLFGPAAEVSVVTDFPGFATEPDEPAIEPLMRILTRRFGGRPKVLGAPYFTDASALVPAFGGVPTVVIGPGEAEQCHQTDEFCFVDRIEEAEQIYEELIEIMCR